MNNYINYLTKKPMFHIQCAIAWDRGHYNGVIDKWVRK